MRTSLTIKLLAWVLAGALVGFGYNRLVACAGST